MDQPKLGRDSLLGSIWRACKLATAFAVPASIVGSIVVLMFPGIAPWQIHIKNLLILLGGSTLVAFLTARTARRRLSRGLPPPPPAPLWNLVFNRLRSGIGTDFKREVRIAVLYDSNVPETAGELAELERLFPHDQPVIDPVDVTAPDTDLDAALDQADGLYIYLTEGISKTPDVRDSVLQWSASDAHKPVLVENWLTRKGVYSWRFDMVSPKSRDAGIWLLFARANYRSSLWRGRARRNRDLVVVLATALLALLLWTSGSFRSAKATEQRLMERGQLVPESLGNLDAGLAKNMSSHSELLSEARAAIQNQDKAQASALEARLRAEIADGLKNLTTFAANDLSARYTLDQKQYLSVSLWRESTDKAKLVELASSTSDALDEFPRDSGTVIGGALISQFAVLWDFYWRPGDGHTAAAWDEDGAEVGFRVDANRIEIQLKNGTKTQIRKSGKTKSLLYVGVSDATGRAFVVGLHTDGSTDQLTRPEFHHELRRLARAVFSVPDELLGPRQ